MTTTWGEFPFGRPNTERPARMVKQADAIVIGVYPSAWHVNWRAPAGHAAPGRHGTVAALAVDVEPTVFWDGAADDFAQRLREWKQAVGFEEGTHGTLSAASPPANGSSGAKVVSGYLGPLGLDPKRTAFTDVYPVFLIKQGSTKRREQGDAIETEYAPVAKALGLPKCTLPARIPRSRLPAQAASRFGPQLRAELQEAAAPLIITLGEEVWDTLLAIRALSATPPRERFAQLYADDAYGTTGTLTIDGKKVKWLPLVHPGLLKEKPDADAPQPEAEGRTTAGWARLHARWARRVASRATAPA